ncbi:MAG: transposase [Candidatus Pristimantibacillus sp.]
MGEQRQRYNEEFKKKAVKYVQENTKSIADICDELSVPKSTLHQWVSQYRSFEDESVHNPERIRQLELELKQKEEEKRQKERENDDLREELEILKKALHIFSKEKN